MSRILVYVQYLKGIGHLQRIGLIAEAAAVRGLDVHIVTGGLPLPGFAPQGASLHQLPPLQAGPGGFSDLRDGDGQPVDDAWRQGRRDGLLALLAAIAPDLLLIEAYPFGRRMLAFELGPLLEAAWVRAPRPAVLSSVRDILQAERKPGRAAETVALLNRRFDAVLVHGDPGFAALAESFPRAGELTMPLHHTGFIAAPEAAFAPQDDTPSGEVVVSMGAGAIGPRLMEAALAARARCALAGAPWRLIAGPHLPEREFARLKQAAGSGVTVERFRRDFRRLLAAARLSISYAGYNTCADLLRAGVPAVLIPYAAGGGETEQTARAGKLAALGLAQVVAERELTPEALGRAVDAALAAPTADAPRFSLNGAPQSALLLERYAAARRARDVGATSGR